MIIHNMPAFSLQDLRDILVSCGGVPPSMAIDDPNVSLQDLGIDSACLLAVTADLERRLGVQLTPDDLPSFLTLGGGVECINRKLARAA